MQPSEAVLDFAARLCSGWKYDESSVVAHIALAFLEISHPKLVHLGPIRSTFRSRRVNCLLCAQPMPLLTELRMNNNVVLDFLSLRTIIGCAKSTLRRVSLRCEGESVISAADLLELNQLDRLEFLLLKGFDFSEENEDHLVQVLTKFGNVLRELEMHACYFGQLGAEAKIPTKLVLEKLYYGTHEHNAVFLEALLHSSVSTLSTLGVSVDSAVANYPPAGLRIKRLRVDAYPEPLRFFSTSLERLSMRTNIANLDAYAGHPFPSLARMRVTAADAQKLWDFAPALNALRCKGQLERIDNLPHQLESFRLREFREPVNLERLTSIRVLELCPVRCINMESQIQSRVLTELSLTSLDFGRDVNAKLTTLLASNPLLRSLTLIEVRWLSHHIFNDETKTLFFSQLEYLKIQSDNSECFQSTIFAQSLLEARSPLALTYLSLTDFKVSVLKMYLAKIKAKNPKIEIARR